MLTRNRISPPTSISELTKTILSHVVGMMKRVEESAIRVCQSRVIAANDLSQQG